MTLVLDVREGEPSEFLYNASCGQEWPVALNISRSEDWRLLFNSLGPLWANPKDNCVSFLTDTAPTVAAWLSYLPARDLGLSCFYTGYVTLLCLSSPALPFCERVREGVRGESRYPYDPIPMLRSPIRKVRAQACVFRLTTRSCAPILRSPSCCIINIYQKPY